MNSRLILNRFAIALIALCGFFVVNTQAKAQLNLSTGDYAILNSQGLHGSRSHSPLNDSDPTLTADNDPVVSNSGGDFQLGSGGTIDSTGNYGAGLSMINGTAEISGGTIDAFNQAIDVNGGTTKISGGNITAGPSGITLINDDGVIDIFGTGFNYTGPVPDFTNGTITGTLLDGTPIDWTFEMGPGTIEFNVGTPPSTSPAPEAGTAASLGILLAAGFAAITRKRVTSTKLTKTL